MSKTWPKSGSSIAAAVDREEQQEGQNEIFQVWEVGRIVLRHQQLHCQIAQRQDN
eukprot:CAMPEP_0195027884 /NCGR_PEP_ID=MMETSP0326_2-20130528/53239_1 /TAXON_ID=2866 ORGANISM="Crypthecodinium cohnii, Strain Seligo" /NCGR_SAMPLE_ID=MMETSP0326_2 /ASSEMBLY_ACC=CAM_ASM_000348 /LENGTH=54 /DNA_ID=CAMNT_0040050221 /DNA_START=168 /DNA_END=331 /DNA_ORIENTATION=+